LAAISVDRCRQEFEDSIQSILAFLNVAKNFKIIQSDSSYKNIGVRQVELITGLVLLKIYLSWEEFIEDVFTRYMCGAKSASGYTPSLTFHKEPNIADAMATLLVGKKYLNWSSNNIIDRADRYFDHGAPFRTVISAIRSTLDEIIIIRNRFAHRSDFSAVEFRKVVLKWCGYVPPGIVPGRFLLSKNPQLGSGQVFIDYYANILLGASYSIVP